jgi:hypothetical protein
MAEQVHPDVDMNIGPNDAKWWLNTDNPYNILPPALQAQRQNCSIDGRAKLISVVEDPSSRKITSYKQGVYVWGIRWHPTLERTFIQFKWTQNPNETPTVRQKHFPAPDPLPRDQLLHAAATYGAEIVAFCEQNIGLKVGDRGECWDLPAEALKILGQKYSLLPACGTVFGQCIYQTGNVGTSGNLNDICPGDIVQFKENCVFESHPGPGETRTERFGSPQHTAYIPSRNLLMLGSFTRFWEMVDLLFTTRIWEVRKWLGLGNLNWGT